MIRIAALNEETDDESESEREEVTREALEEIALQQYAKTLELQKKGNYGVALKLLKALLDTELLYEVEKPQDNSTPSTLVNLKYLCYRNVASISSKLEDNESAIEAYLNASELDDTDVNLWYRLGKISLQCQKFELASFAFQRGVDCNSKHWPSIDNLITLLMGLGNYNDCILNIYKALEIDPDYFRGRVYRKRIFTDYPYIYDYFKLFSSDYEWNSKDDEDLFGEKYNKILKEASDINNIYLEEINKNKIIERLPVLKLQKPIENITWLCLGESLTDMHDYISQKNLSHACVIDFSKPEINVESSISEPMEVDCSQTIIPNDVSNENISDEIKIDVDKNEENKINNESEKEQNDNETLPIQETTNKSGNDSKDVKKSTTRRRGSSLSFLEQWEWCNKRRSSRKKANNRQDRNDETIYDTLKSLLPQNLLSEEMKQKKFKEISTDDSLDTMDIYKLFEEKEKKNTDESVLSNNQNNDQLIYFGTKEEQSDVESFIQKYIDNGCDIITILDDFVLTVSQFWKIQWPENLGNIFVKANNCSKQHYNLPLGYDNTNNKAYNFITINLLHLEIDIDRMLKNDNLNESIDIELLDVLKYLCSRHEDETSETVNIILRYLWMRCHAHLYEENSEFAIDCLYQMIYELNCMSESGNAFSLQVPNFTNKSLITKPIVIDLLKSLERNKQLSTVMNLYEMGKYEEILPILQDSFKHCQIQANKQEWSEMGLDWALHIMILLEILWALENTEKCFTQAVICLHESLKQYQLCTSNNVDCEKWSLIIIKILMIIEFILKKEGSSYLDILPEKALALLVQDIVQIIVHQLDDNNTSEEMPLKTTVPWVLLHYILQREEDCGRTQKKSIDDEANEREEVPPSLNILFTGHNHLGKKGWCSINDNYLLHFILNAVIPRLRSPALLGVVETISQCLEQVVFCLFGHPSKKTKIRYLYDHNITPSKLDWNLSQQIFDLYRPYEMPEFNTYRLGSISNETEQLFQRMLSLLPTSCDPQPYVTDVIAYIENKKENLPDANLNFPYKVRDIYYLLADYYLKNNETIKALKYYAYDIVISKHRFDSWAGIALARASLLETKLNSCETFKSEMEYLNRAAAVERCFKKALEIDSSHSMLWIEYGAFVYGVHSFCSRMLKQASESLSMENFEILEKRKDDMLTTANKCFVSAHREWMNEFESDDKTLQDERWLHYYMLGKISEKKSEPPIVYLDHYIKAGQYLFQNNATYPFKINYNNPQNLSVEALEIHYRIHASILKYIEQHENKTILTPIGKTFKDCLSKCTSGPFSKKKQLKDNQSEKDPSNNTDAAISDNNEDVCINGKSDVEKQTNFKRASEVTDDSEIANKKIKLMSDKSIESEKKSIDNFPTEVSLKEFEKKDIVAGDMMETAGEIVIGLEKDSDASDNLFEKNAETTTFCNVENFQNNISLSINTTEEKFYNNIGQIINNTQNDTIKETDVLSEKNKNIETNKILVSETRRTSQESTTTNTATSKDDSSSDSSSDSTSDDSSSDSSSDTSNDSNSGKTDKTEPTEMSNEDIEEIISICLDNLEECVSRFPQHYKALYRLAHYHFYYKKDKNVERCKDLMLGSFLGRNNTRIQGLFCERKNSNFFNGIWRIPASEVDRPGSFASHMSRCVLITMEILKEIDDHKTLLDLSIQLQKTPEADKKYLRDSERIELSQQAFSLCIRSIKGIYAKYNTNKTERKLINDFILDIYKSYQKIQKHIPSKTQSISTLLIDCYKLLNNITSNESNLLELSIKYCQSLNTMMKQALIANISQNTIPSTTTNTSTTAVTTVTNQTKKVVKNLEQKSTTSTVSSNTFLPTLDLKQSFAKNMFTQNVPNPLLSYLPTIDPLLSTLSYVSNMGNLTNYGSNANTNVLNRDILQKLMSTTLNNQFLQQLQYFQNQNVTTTKPKMPDIGKHSKVNYPQSLHSKKQISVPNQTSKVKTMQKTSNYFANCPNSQTLSGLVKNCTNDITKNLNTTIVNNTLNTSTINIYNINVNNVQGKQSYVTVTQPSTVNNNIKQPPHISQTQANISGNVKSSYLSTPQISTSISNIVKPAHMSNTSTVNAAIHTKPPLPHQQVSPGKTLQEKLAERQKQNPTVSKNIAKPTSPRSIACAAFSGKIPSSLTITKSSSNGKSPVTITGTTNDEQKKSTDGKKNVRFDHKDKTSKPKNIVDTSEIIILDDD